jgi:hypothetical protein
MLSASTAIHTAKYRDLYEVPSIRQMLAATALGLGK